MNCYDCAIDARAREAVAVCVDCGAAVCLDHSHGESVWLTRMEIINRPVKVEPPARVVRCTVCAAAHSALAGDGRRHDRHHDRHLAVTRR